MSAWASASSGVEYIAERGWKSGPTSASRNPAVTVAIATAIPPRSSSGSDTVACRVLRRSSARIVATLFVRSRPNSVTFSAKSRCPSTIGVTFNFTGRNLLQAPCREGYVRRCPAGRLRRDGARAGSGVIAAHWPRRRSHARFQLRTSTPGWDGSSFSSTTSASRPANCSAVVPLGRRVPGAEPPLSIIRRRKPRNEDARLRFSDTARCVAAGLLAATGWLRELEGSPGGWLEVPTDDAPLLHGD